MNGDFPCAKSPITGYIGIVTMNRRGTRRNKVLWQPNQMMAVELPLRRYVSDVSVKSDNVELFERNLSVGGLFITNSLLAIAELVYHRPACHPYLIEAVMISSSMTSAHIKVGEIAIYAGLCYVEEEANKRRLMVARHSFIINGGQYILTNLNLLNPVI